MAATHLVSMLALLATTQGEVSTLDGPKSHAVLLGGHVDSIRVAPHDRSSIVALGGESAFARVAPGRWERVGTAASYAHWPLLSGGYEARLATGQRVTDIAVLEGGLRIGRVPAGFVESHDGFRTLSTPAGLPTIGIRAVSAAPDGSGKIVVCGAPDGLYRCQPPAQCQRELDVPCTALYWFADDTILAGDDSGGVWRFDRGFWNRSRVAQSAIIDIDGVPDGGPRHVRAEDGASWLSQDLGVSWTQKPWPSGRLGSGGMLARITKSGALEVTDLDGTVRVLTDPGRLAAAAPVRWASPELVVVALRDGVAAVEPRARAVRWLKYPEGAGSPAFHTACIIDDRLAILVGSGELLRFEASAEARWTMWRFFQSALGAAGWVAGLVVVLAVLFVWISRRFRYFAGRGRDRR